MQNGDKIEYQAHSKIGVWAQAKYIGQVPGQEVHVIITDTGVISTRESDKIRVPKVKKEGWVNIYPSRSQMAMSGGIHKTEKEAKLNANPTCIACVKIEWFE